MDIYPLTYEVYDLEMIRMWNKLSQWEVVMILLCRELM